MFDLKFSKMHSGFNDFVVIDVRANEYDLKEIKKYAKKIANRKKGIGCDQILVITNSQKADCKMIIYNADGSDSSMCANGLRCIGRMIAEENNRDENEIEISGVIYKAKRKSENTVAVNLGKPKIFWDEIPLAREMQTPVINYSNCGFDRPVVLNVGNPHAVFFLGEDDSLEDIDLPYFGKQIENDSLFPEKINVSFAKAIDRTSLNARTWERGAGETSSCGSAASAIGWAAMFHLWLPPSLKIYFSSDIKISVDILPGDVIESTAEAHYLCKEKLFEVV